jgi:hypothetical protein
VPEKPGEKGRFLVKVRNYGTSGTTNLCWNGWSASFLKRAFALRNYQNNPIEPVPFDIIHFFLLSPIFYMP